jgi:hypothetical protein
LQSRRLTTSTDLIRALGGGYSPAVPLAATQLPK